MTVYLEHEFKASYIITGVLIPYYKYLSYDNTTILRLFISIISIILMANLKSIIGFILCAILNSFCNIGYETSLNCVSLLMPSHKAIKYTQIIYLVDILSSIFASLILSITISFITFQQLFYFCAAIYVLLLIISLFCIFNKESKLITKQLQHFDEIFYVEKKKKILRNKSNKYRRKSSLDESIESYLSINNKIKIESKRIDFPIYERRATEIVEKFQIEQENEENKNKKSDIILTNKDWILIYLSILFDGFNGVTGQIGSNWLLLYLINRFNHSLQLSSIFLFVSSCGSIFGVSLHKKLLNIIQNILFGTNYRSNKQEKIISTCALSFIMILPCIFGILWIYILPYYHFGWFVQFIWGFCGGTIGLLPTNIIMSLNTEHFEQKLLGINLSTYNIFGCSGLFIMGFLWQLQINFFVYTICFCWIIMLLIGGIMIIIAKSIKLKPNNNDII